MLFLRDVSAITIVQSQYGFKKWASLAVCPAGKVLLEPLAIVSWLNADGASAHQGQYRYCILDGRRT